MYTDQVQQANKTQQHQLDEMQRELEKLSNQSRFIQMIIDGKLVVAKKKKAVLVAELQKLGFKRIPKVADAKKAGELEEAAEDEDESDAEAGANDYDYLLGVSICLSLLVFSCLTTYRWPFGL
jgi:DNA topoisomerase-2